MTKTEPPKKKPLPHEAILLSQAIVEQQQIRITFMDGDVHIDNVKWHTPESIGLKDGKVINKQAIKFWEILDLSY